MTDASTWAVVVPVKRLDRAKSRLGVALPRAVRREFVLAMATDTVAACAGATTVRDVLVLSPDPAVLDVARRLGVRAVDEPPDPGPGPAHPDERLNEVLTAALVAAGPGPVAVVTADLPALRPAVLDAVLDAAAGRGAAALPDRHGPGTTIATWDGGRAPDPRFGPGSAARHAATGATLLSETAPGAWAGARHDVDVPADVASVRALGVGPATSAVVRRHADTFARAQQWRP